MYFVFLQVVRSVSKWSIGAETESSILSAYIHAIENAEHFVYIEVCAFSHHMTLSVMYTDIYHSQYKIRAIPALFLSVSAEPVLYLVPAKTHKE